MFLAAILASPCASAGGWRWLQPLPSAMDLRDVTFDNVYMGYAVGANGTFLRASGGGTAWEVRPLPAPASGPGRPDLVAVSAIGGNVVAVGGRVAYVSSSSGDTFTATTGFTSNLVDVGHAGYRAFGLGADGTLWCSLPSTTPCGRTTRGTARTLHFDSDTHGWIGGGDGMGGFIVETSDGGRTFQTVYEGEGPVTSLAGLPRIRVLVAARDQYSPIIRVGAAGPWQNLSPDVGEVEAVAAVEKLPTGFEVWMVGRLGIDAVRSEDLHGGSRMPQPTRTRLRAVAARMPGSAVAVGDGGTIASAMYGFFAPAFLSGGMWQRFALGAFPAADGWIGLLADVDPSTPAFWLARPDGVFAAGPRTDSPARDLSFLDAQRGFALLESGALLATTDGGRNWTTRGGATAAAIAFSSATTGYAAGPGLALTTDGGASWRTALPGAAHGPLADVAVLGTRAVAVSEGGALLERSGTAPDSPWAVAQSVPGSLRRVALSSAMTLAGGAQGAGGVLVLRPASGVGRTVSTASPVRDLAVAAERFFVLFESGEVAEVAPDGVLLNRYESHARLLGLAGRTAATPTGVEARPLALGENGLVLVYEDVPPPNRPPTLSVSPSRLVLDAGEQMFVLAYASDPEGGALSYTWSGAGLDLSWHPQTDKCIVRVPWGVPAGTQLSVRVTACDPQGACTSVDVPVTVGPPANQPPTLSVMPPSATVAPGAGVLLRAIALDPEGGPLTYAWTSARPTPGGTLLLSPADTATTIATLSGTPAPGTLFVARVTVCDVEPSCVTADVELTVATAHGVPSVVIEPARVDLPPDGRATLKAIPGYPPSGLVGFLWTSEPTVGTTNLRLWTPGAAQTDITWDGVPQRGATATVYVRVCDSVPLCADARALVVVVSPPNRPPVVSVAPARVVLAPGQSAVLNAVATDPDGDMITLSWRDAGTGAGGRLTFAPADAARTVVTLEGSPTAGTRRLARLTACDALQACAVADVAVDVLATNRAPKVEIAPARVDLEPTAAATLRGIASDEDGEPISYQWSIRSLAGNVGLRFSDPAGTATEVRWDGTPGPGAAATVGLRACDTRFACTDATASVVLPNHAPLAVAVGASAATGATAVLDGSGSSDPDGDPLSFAWRQLSGAPAQVLGTEHGQLLAVTAPGEPGTCLFELRVCDTGGLCARAEAVLAVTGGTNRAPIAQPPADFRVEPGAAFSLDGTASSDPDGDALAFHWRQADEDGAQVALASADTPVARGVAGADGERYRFLLRVCDTHGACSEAGVRVAVEVERPNRPPVVTVERERIDALSGDDVTLKAIVSDPDGDALREAPWRPLSEQTLALEQTGPWEALLAAPVVTGATELAFALEVCDVRDACASGHVVVTVRPVPREPIADAGPDLAGEADEVLRLDGSRSRDPDGGALTAHWTQLDGPPATLATPDALATEVTLPATGVALRLRFELRVCNPAQLCATDEAVVVVFPHGQLPQIALFFVEPPDGRVPEDSELELAWTARCERVACRAPVVEQTEGLGLAVAGPRRYRAPRVLREAPFAFQASVCDELDRCAVPARLAGVVLDSLNEPPVARVNGPLETTMGTTVLLDASASSDPNGEPLTFAWSVRGDAPFLQPAPADAARALLYVPEGSGGEHLFDVRVCDARGACATATVTVRTVPRPADNRPPTADAGGDRNVLFSGPEVVVPLDGRGSSDPDGDALSFLWSLEPAPDATLEDADQPLATLRLTRAGAPVVVRLVVCDEHSLCAFEPASATVTREAAPPAEPEPRYALVGGCDCGSPGLGAWGLAALLLARRRRRAPRCP